MITDEMYERALSAYNAPTGSLRAALEAIAPRLIAHGMREAVAIGIEKGLFGYGKCILDRAQELDPPPQQQERPLWPHQCE